MSRDLLVPPLVGTYGRAGTGKSSDKIRAFPRAYFFANPGGLIPAISEVGYVPKFEEVSAVMDLDLLRQRVDALLKRDKDIKEIVIDDLSMIAARTERVLKSKIKDGRMLYGAIKERTGNLFDDWRNAGIVVSVDCHEQLPRWKTDEDGVELAHIPDNRVSPGMPNLPGQQSAPEMVKAFDLFYRVVQGSTGILGEGGPWPWRYKAGPWAGGVDWETKDRWGVATAGAEGVLPLNLGEILRWVHRKYQPTTWAVRRPIGYEKDEDLVVWAYETIKAQPHAKATILSNVAKQVLSAATPAGAKQAIDPIKRVVWLTRDIQARLDIEALHSPEATLRGLGISL